MVKACIQLCFYRFQFKLKSLVYATSVVRKNNSRNSKRKNANSLNFPYDDEKVFNYERISMVMLSFVIARYGIISSTSKHLNISIGSPKNSFNVAVLSVCGTKLCNQLWIINEQWIIVRRWKKVWALIWEFKRIFEGKLLIESFSFKI